MKKIFVILTILFSAFVCDAQLLEDFSDGDLTNNPTWTPDQATDWIIVNGQLRSNSAIANSAFYLTTSSSKVLNAQWEFQVNLQFNTSGANYVDVYLVSEQADLVSATNNGYFVRIGGTPDEISLYKITNGISGILINGVDGVTNAANNTLRIKVVRDANNLWTLSRDSAGGTNYFLEGSVTDNSFSTSNFFGIRIQQSTASFFNRHFFDNILVGEIILDTEPPVLQEIQVLANNQLSLLFDEKITAFSAEDVSNYTVSNELGNPSSAVLQPDEKTVALTFSQSFSNGITYQLSASSIEDLLGNVSTSIVQPFLFFQPMPVNYKDIIITEIFADPGPQVGLPEAEFIELFNRSSHPVDLGGWKFSDGNSTASFPSQIVLPGQYWIITTNANSSTFNTYGSTIGISNFPTLNNSGEALTLKTSTGILIDSVNYSLAWYRDEDKQEGGWTLELIDTNNPCGEEDNWSAAEDEKGGTPGKVNSVNANKPDVTGPKLISATVTQSNVLILRFNEKLEKSITPDLFSIDPIIGIVSVTFSSLSLREIILNLNQPLEARKLYKVGITNLRDCSGNTIQPAYNHASFALPEAAVPGDISLNEILFNPRPGGVDFIEIFNTSDKYLNLKNWSFANLEDALPVNTKIISTSDIILAPKVHLVFTSDGVILKDQYPNSFESNFIITTIPAMNDDAGTIALVTEDGLVMDAFAYEEDFHSPLLKDTEGVSLERISFSEPTNNSTNWKSGNSSSGFATPGLINSNTRPENYIDENAVKIEPEIFSPNIPGQDFAQINYRFDQSGLIANIKIIDQQGRIIKEIANNETLSLEGFYRWDGDRQEGNKARMGYYFVWFEVFDLNGTVKTYRNRVVVGQ